MYAPLLGLPNNPFTADDRPIMVFPARYKAELTHLVFSLQSGAGVVELVLEGSLPTMPIAKHLVQQMPDNCRCLFVGNPRLSYLVFLHAICQQLAIPLPSKEYVAPDLVNLIKDVLGDSKLTGETNVLVLNDAQHAPQQVLKQLAVFSAQDPSGASLLRTVLIGHNELRDQLSLPENADIASSVAHRITLPKLDMADTAAYIANRIASAGMIEALPFESDALAAIHTLAEGDPERIDSLCDAGIQKAQAMKKSLVSVQILKKSFASQKRASLLPPIVLNPAPQKTAPPRLQTGQTNTGSTGALQNPVAEPQARERTPIVAERRSVASHLAPPSPRRWGPWAAAAVVLAVLVGGFVWYAQEPTQANLASKSKQVASGVVAETPAVVPAAAQAPLPVEATPGAAVEATPPPATGPEPTPTEASPAVGPAPKLASLGDKVAVEWAGIGKLWGLAIDGERACDHALEQGHQCFRLIGSDLEALKDLDRPGLAQLQVNGVRRWVQVTAWRNGSFTLAADGQQWALSAEAFGQQWTGRYTTLWRQPMDQTKRILAARHEEPAGQWLDEQLQKLQASGDLPSGLNSAKDRISAFEKQHGLPRKGLIMPVTFIKANQLTGVKEPRLTR